MIRYEPLEQAIKQFRTQKCDKIQYIVYECKYLSDLSTDLEAAMGNYIWRKDRNPPLIPESRKNIMLYGYPGYMRELGFYGFVIYGTTWKMYNYLRSLKEGGNRSLFTYIIDPRQDNRGLAEIDHGEVP